MPPPDPLADLARTRVANRVRGKLMRTALRDLLDPVPGARAALPHLAALEQALDRRGASAIDEVPPHWLGKIISQLTSLPLREDDRELQALLAGLRLALHRHQLPPTAPPPAAQPEYLSDFGDSRRLEVREVSHSVFAEEFPTPAVGPPQGDQPR
jgi:hypothetical protein